MRYINESMQGFPSFSSFSGMVDSLRRIVTEGFGEESPDFINGNQFTFNSGYKIHEEAIYLVSDGVNSVYTKAISVDVNNIYIVEDISILNASSIKISSPKLSGWSYSVNGDDHIFSTIKYDIIFNVRTNQYRVCCENLCTTESGALNPNSSKFSLLTNDMDNLVVKVKYSNDMIVMMFNYNNDIAMSTAVINSGTLSMDRMNFKAIEHNAVSEMIPLRFIQNPNGPYGHVFGVVSSDFSENLSFANVFYKNMPIFPLQIIGSIKDQNNNDLFLNIQNQKVAIIPALVYSGNIKSCVAFRFDGAV